MLVHFALWLAAAQPAPFNKVENPTAAPSPWRGDQAFDLVLNTEGTTGPAAAPERWKQEAAATLTVRKTAQRFALSLRGTRWWSGTGGIHCLNRHLLHAQDQDVLTDEHGSVSTVTLHPPPKEARGLGDCPDRAKRQEAAESLWKAIAALSGAAKREIFAQKRVPVPQLGPGAFVDLTLNHARTACGRGAIGVTCPMGIGEERYQRETPPLDRTTSDRMTLDLEGRPRYFHRWQREPSNGHSGRFSILFRPRKPAKRR